MNKLIWSMYNENRISLEVAEELLDCHYNRSTSQYAKQWMSQQKSYGKKLNLKQRDIENTKIHLNV